MQQGPSEESRDLNLHRGKLSRMVLGRCHVNQTSLNLVVNEVGGSTRWHRGLRSGAEMATSTPD